MTAALTILFILAAVAAIASVSLSMAKAASAAGQLSRDLIRCQRNREFVWIAAESGAQPKANARARSVSRPRHPARAIAPSARQPRAAA